MLSTENTQLNFFSIKTPRTPTFSNMVSSPLTPSNLKLQSNIYERLIKEQENVDFIKTLIKLKQKTQNKSNINNNLNIKPKTSIDNIKQSTYIPYQNFKEATTPILTSSKIIKNVSVDSKESENILTYTVIKKKPKPKLNHKLIFEPYSSKSKKSSKFINNFILQKYNINSSKHSFNNKGNQKEYQIQKNVCLTPRKKDSNNNIFTNIQIKQGNVKSYRESKVPRTVIDLFPPENECKVNGNTNLNNQTNKLNKKHKSASTSNMFHNNTNRNNNKTKKECETIRVRVMTPTENVKVNYLMFKQNKNNVINKKHYDEKN